MAIFYVRSTDGNDADSGATWLLAKATLAGAFAVMAAGDTVYVSQSHAETTAGSITLTSPGTLALPCSVICVNDAAEPPTAVATTGTLTVTVNNQHISLIGFCYVYGVKLISEGTIRMIGGPTSWTFEDAVLKLTYAAESTTRNIILGFSSSWSHELILLNSDIDFTASHATRRILILGGHFHWRGGSFIGTIPTNLIQDNGSNTRHVSAVITDVDLSVITGNLTNIASGIAYDINFQRCKINAAATPVGFALSSEGQSVRLHSCDSANTTYRIHEERSTGIVTSETVIVRTGGATDGTTGISHKMVTNGNATVFITPFVGVPLAAWTDSTVSKTYTVEILHDSVTNLQDDEVWLELEYPGADAQGVIADDRAASILTTPADQAASATTWTTTGLTNPNKQKVEVTVTPGKVGPVTARVHLAKPNYTIYVDPKITEA